MLNGRGARTIKRVTARLLAWFAVAVFTCVFFLTATACGKEEQTAEAQDSYGFIGVPTALAVESSVQVGISLNGEAVKEGYSVVFSVAEEYREILSVTADGVLTGVGEGVGSLRADITDKNGKESKIFTPVSVVEVRRYKVIMINNIDLYHYSSVQSRTYGYGTAVTFFSLEDIQQFVFAGWTEELGSGIYLTGVEFLTEEITVYAEWEKRRYEVAFELDGGTMDGNTTVLAESYDVLTLPVPTREGFDFCGWKSTGDTNLIAGGEQVVVLRNETYTAVWSAV